MPVQQAPHRAVVFYDSSGDFAGALPPLRSARDKYPGWVPDYFRGERTRELEEAAMLGVPAAWVTAGLHNVLKRPAAP